MLNFRSPVLGSYTKSILLSPGTPMVVAADTALALATCALGMMLRGSRASAGPLLTKYSALFNPAAETMLLFKPADRSTLAASPAELSVSVGTELLARAMLAAATAGSRSANRRRRNETGRDAMRVLPCLNYHLFANSAH